MTLDYISQVNQVFLDNNLSVSLPDVKRNKVIYVIGSADTGPIQTPIPITNIDEISDIFGSYGSSPLSLKLYETWKATSNADGVRQIYGVRLGGGQYASLTLAETEFTSPDYRVGTASYSLKLTAKYPGDLPVTIRTDIVNTGNGSQDAVIILNPLTGTESVITYNYTNLDDTLVDVHTTSELASAINADPNLNSIITATYPELTAKYELKVDTGQAFYSTENGYGVVTLTDVPISGGVITETANLYTGVTKVAPGAAENLLIEMSSIYELSSVKEQLIAGTGYREFVLTKQPIQYPDYSYKLIDIDAEYPESMVPEYRQIYRQATLGVISDTGTLAYSMDMYLCPDVYGLNASWTTASAESTYYGATSDLGEWADVSSCTSADDSHVVLYFKHTAVASGTTTSSIQPIDPAYYTVTWTHDGTNDEPEVTFTIDSTYMTDYLQAGDVLLIDADSVIGELYEKTTSQQIRASSNFYEYFVSGRKITFGAALPSSIEVSYSYIRNYTIGENVLVDDNQTGKLLFTDTSYTLGSIGSPEVITPNGGTGLGVLATHPYASNPTYPQATTMHAGIPDTNNRLVHRESDDGTLFDIGTAHDSDVRLGLVYTYEPEWPNITYTVQTLNGGTSGISINNADKYDELELVFQQLEPYQPDIVVLGGLYFDDIKIGNNPITGIQENTNAEFHKLLSSFVTTQSNESRPCIGLISAKNPTGFSVEEFNEWYRRLTIIDSSDPTRSANVMYEFKEDTPKFMFVTALPVMKAIGGVQYITDGASTVAAMASALPPSEALNSKTLKSIIGVPFNMRKTTADVITGAGYITYSYLPPKGYIIADDTSVLGYGTDYNSISTVFSVHDLVAEVRDQLINFLGKRYDEKLRLSMDTTVRAIIKDKSNEGIIQAAEPEIYASTIMARLGLVQCKLTIVPAFGVKAITLTVKAALTL